MKRLKNERGGTGLIGVVRFRSGCLHENNVNEQNNIPGYGCWNLLTQEEIKKHQKVTAKVRLKLMISHLLISLGK